MTTARLSDGKDAHTPNPLAYEVRGLGFSYERGTSGVASHSVIRNVSFAVEPGEMLGIVGPNGSGKTSLLKLLGNMARHQQGSIALYGQPLSELRQEAVATKVAFVPQETHQAFPFSVAETVLTGRFPHHHRTIWDLGFGWETAADHAVAQQAMMTMDVWHLAGRPVTGLSGGERQRVIIARALAQDPEVLLLDEPTAFLDLQHQIDICSVLHRLKSERGLTIILVSHDLNLASQYCDRLLLLDRGEVYRIGRPDDVIRPEVLNAVYHCHVLVDRHPVSGLPRVTLPGRDAMAGSRP